MKVLFSFIIACVLSSCSAMVSLYPSYSKIVREDEKQWVHLETNEYVKSDIYNECYDEGRKWVINKNKLPPDSSLYFYEYDISLYQGRCLQKKGFIFKPKSFSKYCYHYSNKIACKAYEKYRK
ncbi:hypothetical protein MHD_11290 [Mannheimia granulomatis]|uniref:Lipoprotein n=1 Tax=Mannheimia granulomatis TaxID=85402 RepID=A0A011NCK1_9PAST|nr:hypothetical protein [Mannheimia granulomatis]EXI62125.1 hypothetical protein AK33_06720 [Mannheimia granulomatis]RGE47180.1 hypothetical protein MHD_11290 [Mannheimia granulomatis]